jgi:hypothetical protein
LGAASRGKGKGGVVDVDILCYIEHTTAQYTHAHTHSSRKQACTMYTHERTSIGAKHEETVRIEAGPGGAEGPVESDNWRA